MNIVRMLGCLWRRHWWEVILFWAMSSLVSWVAIHARVPDSSFSLMWLGVRTEGFVWLEVTIVVWLTGRVALSQQGFGTFGGWQSRPLRAWGLCLAEIVFLVLVFLPALMIRVRSVTEVLVLGPEDWARLWRGNWGGLFFYHAALFVVLKGFGYLGNRMPRLSREQAAWLLLLAAVLVGLFSHQSVLKGTMRLGRSGSSSGLTSRLIIIDPSDPEGMDRGRWLVDEGQAAVVSANEPGIMRVPLQVGASADTGRFRMKVLEVDRVGDDVAVRVEIVTMEKRTDGREVGVGMTIRFGNGYYSAPFGLSEQVVSPVMPFLPSVHYTRAGRMYSPLVLPENSRTWEELLDGAELFVAVGPGWGRDGVARRRNWVHSNGDPVSRQVNAILEGIGRRSPRDRARADAKNRLFETIGDDGVDAVLDRGPWDHKTWRDVVLPYLVRFADERHRPRMLEMLAYSPRMGDAFIRKGWTEEAMPLLRRHLEDGRKLEPESLLALIALGEEEMGTMLENQLLRLNGEVDAVAEAMQAHPGVDWGRVRREGWKRAKLGYGPHHVRVKWGAELGDKEALRQLLAKAIEGNTRERGILQEWFGRDDAVERLREAWKRVEFREGQWVLDAD